MQCSLGHRFEKLAHQTCQYGCGANADPVIAPSADTRSLYALFKHSDKFEHTFSLPLISNSENHYLPHEVHFTTFPLGNFEIKTEVSLDFTCNEELL